MLTFSESHFAVWHDSAYPYLLGGSKARKLKGILGQASQTNSNAIVSAGSASSNHARDCALACAKLGWKCTLAIHDAENYTQPNLFLMKLAGADLRFCTLSDVASVMDSAMADYKRDGLRPYYIWGGQSVHGSKALFDAVSEFAAECDEWMPDYVVVPSGTGGIQAGLHVGFGLLSPQTQVIGVSVARDRTRGKAAVESQVSALKNYLGFTEGLSNPILFDDSYIGAGYGDVYDGLVDVVGAYAKKGLLTDLTYTGKALYGVNAMRKSGEIPQDAKVLFWHTGGALNLLNDKDHLLGKSI